MIKAPVSFDLLSENECAAFVHTSRGVRAAVSRWLQ